MPLNERFMVDDAEHVFADQEYLTGRDHTVVENDVAHQLGRGTH